MRGQEEWGKEEGEERRGRKGEGGREREEGRGRKGEGGRESREAELNVIIMCIGLDRYKTLIINWGVLLLPAHPPCQTHR